MKFAIRDDDACYFTPVASLERVYRDVWDRVPVCLATVPFAVGYQRAGIPREHWSSGEAFPLELNGELVAALNQLTAARRVTVALHGYTHQDYPGGYEFQAASDPERRVRDGLRYLTGLLHTEISVFVPPHNALSKRGLSAVGNAGLNILGSFLSFRPSMRPWDSRTLANWWRVRRYRASTGRTKSDPCIYPRVLRYANHAEFGCHSLIPGTTLDDLVAGFDEARRAGGDFCLATHYWEVSDAMKGVMLRLLDYAGRCDDVRFVTAEELLRVSPAPATRWSQKASALYDPAYARRYRAYDDELQQSGPYRAFAEWLAEACARFVPPIDVLDLGCGTGRYFWALTGVRSLVGIDASASMLEEARHPLHADRITAEQLTLVQGDLLAHDFQPGQFDLIYSIGVLAEHVPLDAVVAGCAQRWLRPGGRFVFTTVHPDSPSIPRTWPRRVGRVLACVAPPAVANRLRARLLADGLYADERRITELFAAGFDIEALRQFDSEVHRHCWCVARKRAA